MDALYILFILSYLTISHPYFYFHCHKVQRRSFSNNNKKSALSSVCLSNHPGLARYRFRPRNPPAWRRGQERHPMRTRPYHRRSFAILRVLTGP